MGNKQLPDKIFSKGVYFIPRLTEKYLYLTVVQEDFMLSNDDVLPFVPSETELFNMFGLNVKFDVNQGIVWIYSIVNS